MVGENSTVIQNPINYSELRSGAIVFVSIVTFTSLLFWMQHGRLEWFAIVMALVIASIAFIFGFWRFEYLGRPRLVELTEAGILLHQRHWRKSVLVPWADVRKLNVAMVEESKRNKNTMDSALFVGEKKYYRLNWRIGIAIREEYRARFGRYPRNVSEEYQQRPRGDRSSARY